MLLQEAAEILLVVQLDRLAAGRLLGSLGEPAGGDENALTGALVDQQPVSSCTGARPTGRRYLFAWTIATPPTTGSGFQA